MQIEQLLISLGFVTVACSCLRWLSLAHSALNNHSAALATLDQWRESEPDNEEIDKISASIRGRKLDPSAADRETSLPAPAFRRT